MTKESESNKLNCSFCGKSQDEVKKLIAGPSVYICNECVDLCNDIIEEEIKNDEELPFDVVLSPLEIYKQLDEYVIGQEKAIEADTSEPISIGQSPNALPSDSIA